MSALASLKNWARQIKRDALMLWFACRHRETPWLVKAWCFFTVAYALSPIDLVPDFIPVLGYVDELLLLPAMIWLAVRILPGTIVQSCRAEADQWLAERHSRPKSYAGAAIIVLLWVGLAYVAWRWLASGN